MMLPALIYISIQTTTPFRGPARKGFLPLPQLPMQCWRGTCQLTSPRYWKDVRIIKSPQRRRTWMTNLWHMFTRHDTANIVCYLPLNARFPKTTPKFSLLPNNTTSVQSWRVKVPSVLLILKIRSQLNKKTILYGQVEMTQNDELIPPGTTSHSCEIWIRSQIRLYSAPSPTGMLWLRLKESREFSSWEARLSWVEISNPSPEAWQPVPNHNWN